MALTPFQQTFCRCIAANRIAQGESYVAGGSALNALLGGRRLSRDIDLFHDTAEALEATWQADRALLETAGYDVRVIHERPAYVEALVGDGNESVLVQWTRDSAFRFFPLVQHDDFGLTLHPVDLATNKALALVGRLEVRDWADIITCHEQVQPLGYLLWAASGKDPAFSPLSILEQAGRSGRYTANEFQELSFEGPPPDVVALSRQWHGMLEDARSIIGLLPVEQAGKCVLEKSGSLCRASEAQLAHDLADERIVFHPGCVRGAFPQVLVEFKPAQ